MRILYPSPLDLALLDAPFSPTEILKAVKHLPMNKASGLDGLPNEFAIHQWDQMQSHVFYIFDELFHHRVDLMPLNEARIVLLPKTDTPFHVTDFRPISVINLLPKIISKVIANRIRPHLDDLISDHQTAFVKGRLIAENFLTTRELLHHVNKAASPAILLKLDFAKAYDMLNWDFLYQVLHAKGFPPKIIKWIACTLNTASSKIEVNGQLSQSFRHMRGLRQGDPLSPYLFILAADVLHQMITNISLAAPYQLTPKVYSPIVNLQYADDTMIIASARGNTLHLLMLAIHCFTEASGLKINYLKSSFVPFSINPDRLQTLESLLQCKITNLPVTYLGMPLTLKAPTRSDFSPLIQKLEKRLQGWQARFISRAGRLQLVKSVLSTIPTYFMSCFHFPAWLIARIDAIRRNFLWNRTGNVASVHLINWQVVCMPEKVGGMGVINIRLQNTALLLRWLWRLYSSDRKLWGNYAAAMYAFQPNHDGPLIFSRSGSFFWKFLLTLKTLFHSCARFRPVSGRRISFWFDCWAGRPLAEGMEKRNISHSRISLRDARSISNQLLMAPLTLQQHQTMSFLSQAFLGQGTDEFVWSLSASGIFSVSSVYRILSQAGRMRSDCALIWKTSVTPSMRVFFFLLLNDRILTQDVLQRRNMNFSPGCAMCNDSQVETATHLFLLCPYAMQIWGAISTLLGYNIINPQDSLKLTYINSIPSKVHRKKWNTMFITTVWCLWLERNQRVFRNKRSPPFVLLNKIRQDSNSYLRFC